MVVAGVIKARIVVGIIVMNVVFEDTSWLDRVRALLLAKVRRLYDCRQHWPYLFPGKGGAFSICPRRGGMRGFAGRS